MLYTVTAQALSRPRRVSQCKVTDEHRSPGVGGCDEMDMQKDTGDHSRTTSTLKVIHPLAVSAAYCATGSVDVQVCDT